MQLPTAWLDVLNKVQTQYPSAVIAGGCLRDLDYGLQPKDVDIFIPNTFDLVGEAEDNIQDVLGDATEIFGQVSDKYDYVRDVNLVLKYTIGDTDYDVIFETIKDKSQTVIDTFDFSICQIMHNGKELTVSGAYSLTKTLKKIFCTRYDKDTFQSRVKRLSEKFGDFTFDTESIEQAEKSAA